MYLNHKKAFTVIESLLGLCLVGWMLSFYLPAFNHAIRQHVILQAENKKWHDLALISQVVQDPSTSEADLENLSTLSDESITMLDYSSTAWSITFDGGEIYDVQLQAIEEAE